MISYMAKIFDEKLNHENFRGVIFCCDERVFELYEDDLLDIFDRIGYSCIAQSIPESEVVHEFLASRLREQLAKEIENSSNRRLKGGLDTKIATAEKEIGSNTKSVHERPETLIGLIENYLLFKVKPTINLMLIVTNPYMFEQNAFEQVVNDILRARTRNQQKAALTFVLPLYFQQQSDILHPKIWFRFIPNNITKEKELFKFVGTGLRNEQHKLLEYYGFSLKKILRSSKGSTTLLYRNCMKNR
jgi:hypothetical protein